MTKAETTQTDSPWAGCPPDQTDTSVRLARQILHANPVLRDKVRTALSREDLDVQEALREVIRFLTLCAEADRRLRTKFFLLVH